MALSRRHAYKFVGLVVLLLFTGLFLVPIIWLVLAPTKTDGQLISQSPFAFGSFSTFGHTFNRVVNYDGQSLLISRTRRSTRSAAPHSPCWQPFPRVMAWR